MKLNINKTGLTFLTLAGVFLAWGRSEAQMNLGNLYTRAVKAGTPWGTIQTDVNKVEMSTKLSHNTAHHKIEIAFTPRELISYNDSSIFADSLESSLSFALGQNTVITELYLWVGKKKVRGYIQEKSLAGQQYNDIVGTRRDPAILQTSGNGYYSLRVFPLESNQTRRIEIHMVQGLESDGESLQTTMPLQFAPSYWYAQNTEERVLEKISLRIRSVDSRQYQLNWPGLGNSTVGRQPQILRARNLSSLGIGTVSNTSSSITSSVWAGFDDRQSHFGLRIPLVREELLSLAPPTKLLILLDVPHTDTLSVERAKKLAGLLVRAYRDQFTGINLAYVDRGGTLRTFYNECVESSRLSYSYLFERLGAWSGSSSASALAALENLPPSVNERTAILLISGQKAEVFDQPNKDRADSLAHSLVKKQYSLFGYWEGGYIQTVSAATWGFRLGVLSLPNLYRLNAASEVAENPLEDLPSYFPDLFDPNRRYSSGPQNITVSSRSGNLRNLVLLHRPTYRWYYGDIMTDVVMRKGSANTTPSSAPYNIRVSGEYFHSAPSGLTIRGTWNGVLFEKEVELDLPRARPPTDYAHQLWAYQKSEELRMEYAGNHRDEILRLGMEHHIVNSQVSLLALEPGMELWQNDPDNNQITVVEDGIQAVPITGMEFAVVNSDMSIADVNSNRIVLLGPSLNLDSLSLENIFGVTTSVSSTPALISKPSFSVITRDGIHIMLHGLTSGAPVTLKILDLSGKVLNETRLSAEAVSLGATWKPENNLTGMLFVQVSTGSWKETQKIYLSP